VPARLASLRQGQRRPAAGTEESGEGFGSVAARGACAMPDDSILHTSQTTSEALKEVVPPVLIALGALSLLRSSRLLGLVAAGAYLYDAAQKVDTDRRRRGVD